MAENKPEGIAEMFGHILGDDALNVAHRFKDQGFQMPTPPHQWSGRFSCTFVKDGIKVTVIFESKEGKALVIEGRTVE